MSERKKSAIVSSLQLRCPDCGKTSMFVNPRLYTYERMGDVKEHCEVCGANLKPETGFYFGAAYVSWALTVALWVSILVALKTFDSLGWIEFGFLTHPVTFLSAGFGATIVLFPYIFRLSRSIWAHMFVKGKNDEKKVVHS